MAALLVAVCLTAASCASNVAPEPYEPTLMAYEAEEAEITNGVFVMVPDEPASAKAALMQPSSVMANTRPAEDAYIKVDIPHADNWTLWSRVSSEARSGESVFLGYDGNLQEVLSQAGSSYDWLPVSTRYLRPGQHRISIGHGDAEVKLDLVVVTNRELSLIDLETWRAMNTPPAAPPPLIEPQ